MACGLAFAYRRPRDYGPGEIARRPDNATVTTIARNDLISISFFENGVRVAKAKFWGQGLTGIALKLDGDETEYLFTSSNDWYKETRHKLKRDIRLMLLADGAPVVEAQRLPEALDGWQKDRSGKYTKLYDIDCAAGHFELVRIGPAQFALRQGETILGIIAMPLPTGVFSPLRTELVSSCRQGSLSRSDCSWRCWWTSRTAIGATLHRHRCGEIIGTPPYTFARLCRFSHSRWPLIFVVKTWKLSDCRS